MKKQLLIIALLCAAFSFDSDAQYKYHYYYYGRPRVRARMRVTPAPPRSAPLKRPGRKNRPLNRLST